MKLKHIPFITVIVGIGGMLGQLLLLREFTISFFGNELTIGIVLSTWLIFEALGAYLSGRKIKSESSALKIYSLLLLLYSILLPVSLTLSGGMSVLLFDTLPGEGAGFLPLFISVLLLVAPVSMVHGAIFPLGCLILQDAEKSNSSIGKIYLFETLGTLAGGVAFTLFLARYFHSAGVGLFVSFIHIAGFCLILMQTSVGKRISVVTIVSAAVVLSFLANPLHRFSLEQKWPHAEVVHYQNTPYGNIVATHSGGEYTFYYDGSPVTTIPSPDTKNIVDYTFFTALAHPCPDKVLLIGTGPGGMIQSFLQHPVKELTYAEIDPVFPEIVSSFSTELTKSELEDGRVSIRSTDGRMYLKTTEKKYDIISLGFLLPETLQTNRLFTEEFLLIASNKLEPGGILSFSLPGSRVYMGHELTGLNSVMYKTAKDVFDYVLVIPGDKNIFLASDSEPDMNPDILYSRLVQRMDDEKYFTKQYLEYRLSEETADWLKSQLHGRDVGINRDFYPSAFFYSISYRSTILSPFISGLFFELEKLGVFFFLIPLLLFFGIIFLVSSIVKQSKNFAISYTIWTSGISGMVFDLLILFVFQSIYGYVYRMTGLFIGLFMGGIFFGGRLALKTDAHLPQIKKLEVLILLLASGFYGFSVLAREFSGLIPQPIIIFSFASFAFISGCATGAQFPAAANAHTGSDSKNVAGSLYAADLFGGWFGGISVSIVMFPLFGLLPSLIGVCLLKLSSFLLLLMKGGK